jgi:hypothetical protein
MSAEIIRLDDYRAGRKMRPRQQRAGLVHLAALRRDLQVGETAHPADEHGDGAS